MIYKDKLYYFCIHNNRNPIKTLSMYTGRGWRRLGEDKWFNSNVTYLCHSFASWYPALKNINNNKNDLFSFLGAAHFSFTRKGYNSVPEVLRKYGGPCNGGQPPRGCGRDIGARARGMWRSWETAMDSHIRRHREQARYHVEHADDDVRRCDSGLVVRMAKPNFRFQWQLRGIFENVQSSSKLLCRRHVYVDSLQWW